MFVLLLVLLSFLQGYAAFDLKEELSKSEFCERICDYLRGSSFGYEKTSMQNPVVKLRSIMQEEFESFMDDAKAMNIPADVGVRVSLINGKRKERLYLLIEAKSGYCLRMQKICLWPFSFENDHAKTILDHCEESEAPLEKAMLIILWRRAILTQAYTAEEAKELDVRQALKDTLQFYTLNDLKKALISSMS